MLAGSDTGALFAIGLVASGRLPEADALVLAGLPTVTAQPGPDAAAETTAGGGQTADSGWEAELGGQDGLPHAPRQARRARSAPWRALRARA